METETKAVLPITSSTPVDFVIAEWFLRLAIATGFLSAVADRFGVWGSPGASGVAWGNWDAFIVYVGQLNWFMPFSFHNLMGWAATIAEIVIALGLVAGFGLRWFAVAAGSLALLFAVTMTVALGIKAPLDYSVFIVSAAAFYLAAICWRKGNPDAGFSVL